MKTWIQVCVNPASEMPALLWHTRACKSYSMGTQAGLVRAPRTVPLPSARVFTFKQAAWSSFVGALDAQAHIYKQCRAATTPALGSHPLGERHDPSQQQKQKWYKGQASELTHRGTTNVVQAPDVQTCRAPHDQKQYNRLVVMTPDLQQLNRDTLSSSSLIAA